MMIEVNLDENQATRLTLKAFLMSADSLEMTPRSSAAVLHWRICLMTSRNFKLDIF